MTQEERKERSKQEIFHAAMAEFGTKEYEKVTMESICTNHRISKGMMYHYYSGKDELFLLCVQNTFDALKTYIEKNAANLTGQNAFDALKNYFLLREYFFEQDPKGKRIFETALLHAPKHLADQILRLHEPIQKMNRDFLEKVASHTSLRQDLDQERVTRYLESVEHVLSSMVACYQRDPSSHDLHSALESVQEVLDMMLFGVLAQAENPFVN